MTKYTVKFYEGDYPERQEAANRDGAICYVEHHLNSREYKDERPGLEDNPILTVVAHNANVKSVEWAKGYSRRVKTAFPQLPLYQNAISPGVLLRSFKERGDYNLRFTKMPAILVEPMWVSDAEQVALLFEENTREALAHCLVGSIRAAFPEGGLVAFSIGHMGKTSQPFDRGAPVRGKEKTSFPTEADFCSDIMHRAGDLIRVLSNPAFQQPQEDITLVMARILLRFDLAPEEVKKLKAFLE